MPLKIKVAGGKTGVKLKHEEVYDSLEVIEEDKPLSVEMIEEEKPLPVMTIEEKKPLAVQVIEEPPTPASTANQEDSPFSLDGSAPVDTTIKAGPPSSTTMPKPAPGLPLPVRLVMHFVPLAVLFLCLLTPCLHDVFVKDKSKGAGKVTGGEDDEKVDLRPSVKLVFDEGKGAVDYTDSMAFAVHKIYADKNVPSVKLNWYENGFGNSTVLMIDGKEALFGNAPDSGIWAKEYRSAGAAVPGKPAGSKTRTFEFSKGVHVNQTVTLEPSEPIEVAPGDYKRVLSTCLARYKIHNTDKVTHKVGLRVLLDTCIGENDGVPFLLPGVNELVDTFKEFNGPDVPDFVQVLERPNLANPGIIVQLNLRIGEIGKGERVEPPDRFLLTLYPKLNNDYKKWKIVLTSFKENKDSCVVMYWQPKDLPPGKTREVGFAYGLGSVSSEAGKLAVTVGGAFRINGELTVVALVSDRDAKTATLDLPAGLRLIDPKTKTQNIIPPRSDRPSPVTWRVQAIGEGRHSIVVSTDTGLKQTRRLQITDKSLFN